MGQPDTLSISKTFLVDRKTLFEYCIRPDLIEKWSYPDGMTLKVKQFQNHVGGTYRFEHTDKKGEVWVCTGYLEEFIPGQKLVQVDTVYRPDGSIMFKDLVCITTFKERPAGTEMSVMQRGFPDTQSMRECEEAWKQCFEHLSQILSDKDNIFLREDTYLRSSSSTL